METKIYQNIDELRNLVSVLSSPEEKLNFLRSISNTGDTIVLDLIFEMDDDPGSDTLENGLMLAFQKNDQELISKYGEKAVDYYFENGYVILLPEKLLEWNNKKLTEYVVSKLPQSQQEEHLSEAVDFYEKMGIKNDLSKKLEEKLLAMELLSSYSYKAGRRLVKLGRYTEAIEHYLKRSEPYCLRDAWDIAKEHVPAMKKRIAERVWKMGLIEKACELTYAESSQELNCANKAVKELKKYVSNLKPNTGRFFTTLVKALKLLGLSDEVNKVLSVARKHTNSIIDFPWDAYKEMIQLCDIAEENEESKQWMIKRLKYEIAETHPSNAPNTIAEYEKKTGDTSFRMMLFPFFEKHQQYGEAEKLAIEFNLPEKAEKYSKLAELFVASHIQ